MNSRYLFALLFVLLSWFLTHMNAQFRIINGLDIRIEESTHSVAIFGNTGYLCVGSLVNVNSVVTAAHCVKKKDWRNLVLVAGVTDIRQRNTGRQQRRNVRYIHYHHGYDPDTLFMDVAVVKVDRSFKENNAVKSILLCDDRLVPGMTIQVSGWGRISATSKVHSYHLKTKHLDIVDTQTCKAAYANLRYPTNLAETIICAGCGGEDTCIGDSGAGAVRNKRLCAVVQGGCGNRNAPDTYTDVTNAKVRNFIISKM